MKVVELFSGNGDITKEFIRSGIECVSVDYDPDKNPDIVADVYKLDESFLKQFDFIWLSPDCTTYSLAGHGIHRRAGGIAVSRYAKECDINNEKLINLLLKLDIPFICENPRSLFRKMWYVKDLPHITVYYSTYGMDYSKPTDLFTNRPELLKGFNTEKKAAKIHLDYAVCNPKKFLDRCKMPEKLIKNIVEVVKGYLK